MNRNVESHFSELPNVDIERSMFDRSASHKTSFNVGELIPFYVDEVLPGDTFNVTTSIVARLQTLLTPIMDNVYLDTYYFYVKNIVLWEHWKQFMGENTDSPWLPANTYVVPKISFPSGGWNVGTIADYMGIPTGVDTNVTNDFVNALPFRGYAMVCDTWFRDQNVTDPLNIPVNDTIVQGSNGTNYITDVAKGGAPFKVAKYHDYFTSCLPAPQKSAGVSIFGWQLGSNNGQLTDPSTYVPVRTYGANSTNSYNPIYSSQPMVLSYFNVNASGAPTLNQTRKALNFTPILNSSSNSVTGITFDNANKDSFEGIAPANLWADVGQLQLSINTLRLAFQLQKFYEKNARAGTRYREVILEHFGVRSPDQEMYIPEYLGGHRFPLSIHQVANQSQGANDFLGDLGAMSNTADVHEDFVKSFTQHGFVIGVCCVRYDHSYPQGLEKFWNRTNATDYYWPVFANIGEQPVMKKEICLEASSTQTPSQNNNAVFGYQEAWAEYRYKPNRVSGEMRPGIQNSLATWHLADYYQSVPSLSDAWIREEKANVDRTLAVTSDVSNQVFCDFYVKNICTRPMPMYSIPGLIDHH